MMIGVGNCGFVCEGVTSVCAVEVVVYCVEYGLMIGGDEVGMFMYVLVLCVLMMFLRSVYEFVEATSSAFAELYDGVSRDDGFLREMLWGVIKNDVFMVVLWDVYEWSGG